MLSKACEYIIDLQSANSQMVETLKETERLAGETDELRQQCERLQEENDFFSAQFHANGLVPSPAPHKT